MVISRLKIENFRSIKSLDMALSQQCALVGQNNAGKSNILEALRRVLSGSYLSVTHFSNSDIYGFDPGNDIKITCEIDPPIKYNKLKNADPVDIHSLQFVYTKYIIGDQKGQPRLEQTCLGTDEKQLSVMTQYGKTGNKPKFEPLVSIDFSGNSFSVIVDGLLTDVDANIIKIIAWYDNEWAYSVRLKNFLEQHSN